MTISHPDLTDLEKSAVTVDSLDDMLRYIFATLSGLFPDRQVIALPVFTPRLRVGLLEGDSYCPILA
jgi:hypothetical protein